MDTGTDCVRPENSSGGGSTAGKPSVVLVTRKVRHDGHAALLAELLSSTM
ncbi:hypothetical protein [Streptomyces anulatus]|nr:hypothetical protein [Streptomyces anulatus]MDF9808681.1 hypothetical protein [Streptomyces sp. HB372]